MASTIHVSGRRWALRRWRWLRHDADAVDLEQVVAGGDDHGRNREEERKLQRRRAVHARQFAGGDGRHGTRGARETPPKVSGTDRSRWPARSDICSMSVGQLAARERLMLRALVDRVHDPHHDAADDQRPRHDVNVFQMLADDFGQQERRDGGAHERDHGQRQRMGQ